MKVLFFLLLFTVSVQAQFQRLPTISEPKPNQFLDSVDVVVLLWDGDSLSEAVLTMFERYENFTDYDVDPPRPVRFVVEHGFATPWTEDRERYWVLNQYVITILRRWKQ